MDCILRWIYYSESAHTLVSPFPSVRQCFYAVTMHDDIHDFKREVKLNIHSLNNTQNKPLLKVINKCIILYSL